MIFQGVALHSIFVSENKRSFSFIFLIYIPLDIVIYTVYPKIIIITYKNSFKKQVFQNRKKILNSSVNNCRIDLIANEKRGRKNGRIFRKATRETNHADLLVKHGYG